MIDCTDTAKRRSQWKVIAGVLTNNVRIYVPVINSLRGKVISLIHDIPESGHFAALKTTVLGSRDYYWPVLDSRVRKYVRGSDVGHRIKAPRHARHGMNMPLEAPSQAWEGITMDSVTDMSESPASGHTGILIIVDRLTNMGICLPCRQDIDLLELACLCFEPDICKRGIPENIVTDCGTQFTGPVWTLVCAHMSTDHWLSTDFHPQTDGQT
jgi:hypothetical protein